MSSNSNKFWSVSFEHVDTGESWRLTIQAPSSHSKERLFDILREVHPEYANLTAKEIDRPAHIRAWEEADTVPPPPLSSD